MGQIRIFTYFGPDFKGSNLKFLLKAQLTVFLIEYLVGYSLIDLLGFIIIPT